MTILLLFPILASFVPFLSYYSEPSDAYNDALLSSKSRSRSIKTPPQIDKPHNQFTSQKHRTACSHVLAASLPSKADPVRNLMSTLGKPTYKTLTNYSHPNLLVKKTSLSSWKIRSMKYGRIILSLNISLYVGSLHN
ncbi:hypothetical protein BDQ17DRAFT_617343 [Cyathus striatus]|nr:hypothetical protein BDQ17DRAFT_617343 [Cyathus striatus]